MTNDALGRPDHRPRRSVARATLVAGALVAGVLLGACGGRDGGGGGGPVPTVPAETTVVTVPAGG